MIYLPRTEILSDKEIEMKKTTVHVAKSRDVSSAEKDAEFTRKLENSILHAAGLSGVFYRGPWEDDSHTPLIHTAHIGKKQKTEDIENLAPPPELRHWYSSDNSENYLNHGKYFARRLKELSEAEIGDFRSGDDIMEIGCSAGRIIRWFEPETQKGARVWGADIDASAIMWAQENLPSTLQFFTSTTAPSLPFRDGKFNLIFGASLFTHIGELADAWFLEIARLLDQERGIAIISMNDDETLRYLKAEYPDPDRMPYNNPKQALKTVRELEERGDSLGKLVFNSSPWQQSVWYAQAFLVPRLERIFHVKILPQFNAYQTGYVLRVRS